MAAGELAFSETDKQSQPPFVLHDSFNLIESGKDLYARLISEC